MHGSTPHHIAETLTFKNIPTPGGKEVWTTSTIESILTNEKYKGSALLQKKFTVDFLTKKTKINEGEVPQYFVKHSHPPIVDPEEFDMVQAKIAWRLSRKELLDGMVRELETANLALTQFDEKLWRIMVENVTVGLDGEMVFRFRNGLEVNAE